MKKFMMAALAALVTVAAAAILAASVADAREDGPSSKEIREYAFSYMKQFSKQNMSDREIANQLASSIIWLEKVQLVCPSYYYVNASRARYDYLLRQGTWAMMFGPGKTSTSIMNEASAKGSSGISRSI
jgi:hypothetical protein